MLTTHRGDLSKLHLFGISETTAKRQLRPSRQSVYRPQQHGLSRAHLQAGSRASKLAPPQS